MKTKLLKKIRRKFVIWYDPNDEFYMLKETAVIIFGFKFDTTFDDVYRDRDRLTIMNSYRRLVKDQLEKYRKPEPRKPIVYIKHNEK